MKKHHYKKSIPLLILIFTIVFLMLYKETDVRAASLQVQARYDALTPTQALEVVLSVNSSSEITMAKYDYKRAANTRYFTENSKKGTNIEKNSEGFWNACGNKEVRSIVEMKNGTIIASALKSETLVSRYVEMTKGGFVNGSKYYSFK